MYHVYIILLVQILVVLWPKRLPASALVYFSLTSMALLLGFRDPFYGSDTPTYVEYFLNVESIGEALFGSFFWKAEYTFFFLGGLFSEVYRSPTFIVLGYSLFCNLFLASAILSLRNKFEIDIKFILISILSTSTFYLFEVNVLRQFLAFSIFIFWFSRFYLNSRIFDFSGLIFIVLSLFSHNSIVIFFAIPYAIHFFYQKRWFLIFLIFTVSLYFASYASNKVEAYSQLNFDSSANYPIKAIALFCHLLFISIINYISKIKFNKVLLILWLLYALEIFLSFITGWKAAERLHMYSVLLVIFVTPIYLSRFRRNLHYQSLLLGYYLLCMIYTVFVLNSNSLRLLIRY